jgi:hypothetical protein
MNASGNAVAVWIENGDVTVNRFSLTTGWGATTTVIDSNGGGYAFDPDVAIDPAGNALVVWDRYDGVLRNHLWSNGFKTDAGWGKSKLIEGDAVGRTDAPQIAVDSSGNAIVVWQQSEGARPNFWQNRFDRANGWGSAALVETDNAGPAQYPAVALGPSGTAIAVWQQSDGKQNKILSAFFH